MNRFWVRLSIVIGLVVVVVVLVPILMRHLLEMPVRPVPPPPPYPTVSSESMPALQNYFERFFWQRTLITLLIGGAVGVLAGILSSRWLTAPLSRLQQAVQAISRHQLSTRVPEKGSLEVKSLARSFNQMAADLEEAEVLRRNLLADVSHELRHPAHLLQGNLQAIQDGIYPLEMGEIETLSAQAQHLTRLINDLYLLSQAEAQQLPLNSQNADLVALLNSVLESYQTRAASNQVAMQFTPPAEAVCVEIDVMRMRQVLQNLLDNALRYTPSGGEVHLKLRVDIESVSIIIRDSGAGIPAEQIAHVFDRFYRVDATRSRSETNGSGLGLAIAQAFVHAHGGAISVCSTPGQGAEFTIALPRRGQTC